MRRQAPLVLLAVLMSCSPAAEETASSTADEAGDSEAAPVTEPATTADILTDDPFARVRDAYFGRRDMTEREWVAFRDELITACMAESGFEYLPTPLPEERIDFFTVPPESRRQFIEEFGYGQTTLYWEQERAWALAAANYVDPNDEVRSRMSEAELEAYESALRGPVLDVWAEGEIREEDGIETVNEMQDELVIRDEPQGCVNRAEVEIAGVDHSLLDNDTQLVLDAVWERVFADPRLEEADEAWHQCMAGAGYPIERVELDGVSVSMTGLDLVLRNLDELNQSARWVTETLTANDGTEVELQVPIYDEETLARAREEELAIAMADHICDEEVGRKLILDEVSAEIQNEVIAEHFTELAEALVSDDE